MEIDSLTGRIAKQLYQKANIAIEGFEKTNLPDDHFDVVLGNVPFEMCIRDRGLSYSRPNITDRARASAWQVRFDAQGLSGEAQASDLSQSADIGQAERASARGRADSLSLIHISGKKVLLIDADAQANLTMALGYNRPDDIPITLSTVCLLYTSRCV